MALAWMVAGSTDVGAEGKPGARIGVEKPGGQVIEGELVAVKAGSLLMADSSSLQPAEIEMNGVIRICIKRQTKLLKGLVWGVLAGAATGAIRGYFHTSPDYGQSNFVRLGVAYGTPMGAALGLLFAAEAGSDRVIEWAALSGDDRNKVLVKLRKISRFPNEYADRVPFPFP